MAETYTTGQRVSWKGPWQANCLYCAGDMVTNNDLLVMATERHLSGNDNEPGVGENSGAYWTDPTKVLPAPGVAGSPLYSDGAGYKNDPNAQMKMKSAQAEDGVGATSLDGRQLDIQDASGDRGLTVTPESGATFSDVNAGRSTGFDDTGLTVADGPTSGKIIADRAKAIELSGASPTNAFLVAEDRGTTVAELVNGLLPVNRLPGLAIVGTFPVPSEAAMLALVAEPGDVAFRTDLSNVVILAGSDPSVLANWKQWLYPAPLVTSVDGQTGVVDLTEVYVPLDDARLADDTVALTMTGNSCTPDFSAGNFFEVTLTGADTLQNPANPRVNQTGRMTIRQPAGGACTLAFGSFYKFLGSVDPGVSTGANEVNILYFDVVSATEIVCELKQKVG